MIGNNKPCVGCYCRFQEDCLSADSGDLSSDDEMKQAVSQKFMS